MMIELNTVLLHMCMYKFKCPKCVTEYWLELHFQASCFFSNDYVILESWMGIAFSVQLPKYISFWNSALVKMMLTDFQVLTSLWIIKSLLSI
jgi:hypothetical protein